MAHEGGLEDTSDISYAQQEKFPADIRVGLSRVALTLRMVRQCLGRAVIQSLRSGGNGTVTDTGRAERRGAILPAM